MLVLLRFHPVVVQRLTFIERPARPPSTEVRHHSPEHPATIAPNGHEAAVHARWLTFPSVKMANRPFLPANGNGRLPSVESRLCP